MNKSEREIAAMAEFEKARELYEASPDKSGEMSFDEWCGMILRSAYQARCNGDMELLRCYKHVDSRNINPEAFTSLIKSQNICRGFWSEEEFLLNKSLMKYA